MYASTCSSRLTSTRTSSMVSSACTTAASNSAGEAKRRWMSCSRVSIESLEMSCAPKRSTSRKRSACAMSASRIWRESPVGKKRISRIWLISLTVSTCWSMRAATRSMVTAEAGRNATANSQPPTANLLDTLIAIPTFCSTLALLARECQSDELETRSPRR